MTDRNRRKFMMNVSQLALAVGTSFSLPIHRAFARDSTSITVDRSTARVAAGADCTTLLQGAIDRLPVSGGEVVVPDGDYLIDPVIGLKLRSRVTLRLLPGAIIRAKPTAAGSYAIFRILNATDVAIMGGNIIGERDGHLGHAGEWGMGIDIRGSHAVRIDGLHISDCWGDGIYIGSSTSNNSGTCSDITLTDVICDSNRRQGLSIVSCNGALIEHCEFNHTKGTSPSAGIDIEPNRGQTVKNVRIVDCKAIGNAGDGFQFYAAAVGASINNCEVSGGTSKANLGSGLSLAGASGSRISGVNIVDNVHYGVHVSASSTNSSFAGNKIIDNNTGPKKLLDTVLSGAVKGILVDGVYVEKGARGTKVESKSVFP